MTEDSFAGLSWIRGAKYNTETERMVIYIGEGSEVYECEGVPKDVWLEFKRAESKGKYFNNYIRGQYVSSKI